MYAPHNVKRTPFKTGAYANQLFKPMLAATLEGLDRLHSAPWLVSPKIDGIRAVIWHGQVMSRNFKPIPNKFIQESLKHLPHGLDGELIAGDWQGEGVFNRTSSAVMSIEGEPAFSFRVFDWAEHPLLAFQDRLTRLEQMLADVKHPRTFLVPHKLLHKPEQLSRQEEEYIAAGFEGMMIRRADGHYKMGRATHREGLLWKLKRFRDGEATVVEVEEGVINTNEPRRNALGAVERSSHQDGMVPSGMVGALIATDLVTGQRLRIAPGTMTHTEREVLMAEPSRLVGKVIKYKAFDYGTLNHPRFCTFQGFRDAIDL